MVSFSMLAPGSLIWLVSQADKQVHRVVRQPYGNATNEKGPDAQLRAVTPHFAMSFATFNVQKQDFCAAFPINPDSCDECRDEIQ